MLSEQRQPTPAARTARGLLRLGKLRGRRPPPTTSEPRTLRAIVAYDGTDWAGWQRQPEAVGVAEMVVAALEAATGIEPVSLHAAGRTDAGVHAEGQAVSFRARTALPIPAILHLCQALLPPSIRVCCVEDAPPAWNPQRDAVGKLYRYRLLERVRPAPSLERIAWRLPAALDLDAVRAAASEVVGTHDFRTFRNDPGPARRDEDTVRTLESLDVRRVEDLVAIDVRGPGFLYMMVRNLVAALVLVGHGAQEPSWVGSLLAARDRRLGPPPAPPHGLTLVRVHYPDGFGTASPA